MAAVGVVLGFESGGSTAVPDMTNVQGQGRYWSGHCRRSKFDAMSLIQSEKPMGGPA